MIFHINIKNSGLAQLTLFLVMEYIHITEKMKNEFDYKLMKIEYTTTLYNLFVKQPIQLTNSPS